MFRRCVRRDVHGSRSVVDARDRLEDACRQRTGPSDHTRFDSSFVVDGERETCRRLHPWDGDGMSMDHKGKSNGTWPRLELGRRPSTPRGTTTCNVGTRPVV
mmetsp:Transcript_926/g.5825  ORF Transcript_926/g.5825 Transcript_926/m.5825 type:complete len:102 (+) Transcript_926:4397-4702(+)